jgi:hypothetical protein
MMSCQRDHAPSASDSEISIAKQDWQAQDALLIAGEKATDCASAASAMRTVLAIHRNELLAAHRQLANRDTVKRVTDYIEAHPSEFPDLDERWAALSDRCPHDVAVQSVLREKDLDPGSAEEPPASP